jgi:hypothetical protein
MSAARSAAARCCTLQTVNAWLRGRLVVVAGARVPRQAVVQGRGRVAGCAPGVQGSGTARRRASGLPGRGGGCVLRAAEFGTAWPGPLV